MITDASICAMFCQAADLSRRELLCGDHRVMVYSIDGLVSGNAASEYVVKPMTETLRGDSMEALYTQALRGSIYNIVAVPCISSEDAAGKLVNGFCVVLFPEVGAIAFEVKSGEKRNPAPPALENTVKGPKDAFVETLRTNTALVRKHLRSPELQLWETAVGRRSHTAVGLVWLRGITNEEYIVRMKERISSIDIDGLLSPSAVEEYVTGSRRTAFPLLQYTERADTFCRGLLDGRVGLLVDGLPLGYLAPVDLGYLMESPEDRSRDYLSASCVRVLRWAALLLDLLLPGLYVAFAMHHPQLLSDGLRPVLTQAVGKLPFSPGGEALGMLVAFELLQESGIHLPQSIGQSVSTIGGIVVGSAAVEAGLVSPGALIMISLAGICGFVLPNRDLANAVRYWRFLVAAAAAAGGLWGMGIALAVLLVHLGSQKSLGVPYLAVRKSALIRQRLVDQKYRNPRLKPDDKKNQKM